MRELTEGNKIGVRDKKEVDHATEGRLQCRQPWLAGSQPGGRVKLPTSLLTEDWRAPLQPAES